MRAGGVEVWSYGRIWLVACVFAMGVVALAGVRRWEGARTDLDAYVPLRPLRAEEAAALLRWRPEVGLKPAFVLAYDAQSVTIGSGYYLLPAVAGEATAEVTVSGQKFGAYAVSWNGYYIVHHIERAALERALGRALVPSDVQVAWGHGRAASFDSSLLWLYALCEAAWVAWVCGVLGSAWRATRSAWVVPPLLLLVQIGLVFGLGLYAPAFNDADAFHQRILVEDLWLPALMFLPLTALATLGSVAAWVPRRWQSVRV